MEEQPSQVTAVLSKQAVARSSRIHWLWIALSVGATLLVGGCVFGSSLWLSYATGNYRSQNNITITNAAKQAALEAIAANPGAELYLEEFDHFEYRVQIRPNPPRGRRILQITERGVPITVDARTENFHLMRPAILHDGRKDKTQGYEVVLRGLR